MAFARIGGVRIAYDDHGPRGAPAVVFGHSLATARGVWAGQAARLADRFRVVAFDLRGHGESDVVDAPTGLPELADDVAGLIRALDLAPAVYVGLSVGGMVGQHLALEHGGLLAGAALCCTTGRTPPEARPLWRERIEAVRAGGMETQVAPSLERWFTAPFRAERPEIVDAVAAMIRATPPVGFIRTCEAIMELDTLDRLGEARIPTLVLSGEKDPGTPPAVGRALAEAIPGAEFAIIPNAAHQAMLERPDAFEAALFPFLERVAAR